MLDVLTIKLCLLSKPGTPCFVPTKCRCRHGKCTAFFAKSKNFCIFVSQKKRDA